MDKVKIRRALRDELPGIALRPAMFEPTMNKWQNVPCRGFQIHVTDPRSYQPYKTTLLLMRAVMMHHRDRFEWKSPPYEYEYERMPIDLLIGDREIRRRLEDLEPVDGMETDWQDGLQHFKSISREYHLYGLKKYD